MIAHNLNFLGKNHSISLASQPFADLRKICGRLEKLPHLTYEGFFAGKSTQCLELILYNSFELWVILFYLQIYLQISLSIGQIKGSQWRVEEELS